ncbi:beta xylosidase [Striga asiatica]|uniref:Beta xylosidase n=1 Tax=Striga asiatica TaxID=4170 RepID=A0A5A7Q0P0_STRAF|nr:beta xylosidase [Striga asiatica]
MHCLLKNVRLLRRQLKKLQLLKKPKFLLRILPRSRLLQPKWRKAPNVNNLKDPKYGVGKVKGYDIIRNNRGGKDPKVMYKYTHFIKSVSIPKDKVNKYQGEQFTQLKSANCCRFHGFRSIVPEYSLLQEE